MLFNTYGTPEWLPGNEYLDYLICRRMIQGGGVIWNETSTNSVNNAKTGVLQEKAGSINMFINGQARDQVT